MDLKPFKLDIDELINDFAESEMATLVDMKKLWLSRKFSFIFEGHPTTNLGFFMQSLYAHTIGHLASADSLPRRLAGLYCLYCLHETQPFKPPFKIYLSLGELKRLKNLVADAKKKDLKIVSAVVKSMLERNLFLFGFVDVNDASVMDRVNELIDVQNARVRVANKKLFESTRLEHFIHMDMGVELDVNSLKKISTEYSVAKENAIREAGKVVDAQNIKHIAENNMLIGDVVEKTTEFWNAQKQLFYQQTGLALPTSKKPIQDNRHEEISEERGSFELVEVGEKESENDESFGYELEEELLSYEDFERMKDEGTFSDRADNEEELGRA